MTAPLPPLPKFLVALLPHEERAMQSYAKLAVREALERAAELCRKEGDQWVDHTSKLVGYHCANAIRAMLKELDK